MSKKKKGKKKEASKKKPSKAAKKGKKPAKKLVRIRPFVFQVQSKRMLYASGIWAASAKEALDIVVENLAHKGKVGKVKGKAVLTLALDKAKAQKGDKKGPLDLSVTAALADRNSPTPDGKKGDVFIITAASPDTSLEAPMVMLAKGPQGAAKAALKTLKLKPFNDAPLVKKKQGKTTVYQQRISSKAWGKAMKIKSKGNVVMTVHPFTFVNPKDAPKDFDVKTWSVKGTGKGKSKADKGKKSAKGKKGSKAGKSKKPAKSSKGKKSTKKKGKK